MKKIKYVLFSIITLVLFNNKVYASGSMSVNTGQVYSGGNFTVTANISGAATWDVHVSASGPVSNCSIQQAGYTQDLSETSKSWSATCTATGTGNIKVYLTGSITNGNGNTSSISDSKTVSVISKPSGGSTSNNGGNTNKTNYNNNTKKTETKSSNNYLKSYAIDGYKISPDFDKNKTDYTLTVPNGTTKVKILAYQESNKAKLSGDDGEVEVKEGENKLSTTVIAEDGSKKTYNINIIVESKPIIVKLNSQEYTLIKNKDELPNIDLEHEDMSLNFEGVDIPAYRIDKIGYMLVGLKDKDNNTKLYEYVSYKDNEKPEEYHLFNYLKINNLNLIILDFPTNKIPSDYKQYIEKIGDNDYTVYKLDKDSNYSLIYATNFDTGKNNIYKYEKSENTIQIYEKVAKKESVNNTEKYKKLILIMGIAIIILVLLTTIGFTKKPKIKKVKHEDKELTKKDIKKIEKSTKKENKKNKKRQRKGEPEL